MSRQDLMSGLVSDRRHTDSANAWAAFEEFCARLTLETTADAAAIYLTWLHESGVDSRLLRRRLSALDLALRINGQAPFSRAEAVRRWLRGFHNAEPVGGTEPRSDPLYRELVLVLAAVAMEPTPVQRASVVATLLTYHLDLSAVVLARLRWTNVRLRVATATIRLPSAHDEVVAPTRVDRTNEPDCVVQAMHLLRPHQKVLGEFLLGGRGNTNDEARVRKYTRPVRDQSASTSTTSTSKARLGIAIADALKPGAQQLRDRSVLTLGFACAMGVNEAIRLRQADITTDAAGLLVKVPGRPGSPVRVFRTGGHSCPVAAWTDWRAELKRQKARLLPLPAFTQVSGGVIWKKPLTPMGLNYLIHQRCDQAKLVGTFTFTSLRSGSIRTAVREDQSSHVIASNAALKSLHSVARHEARERIITHNVAGMLGL